jgi:hypothetical protein
MNRKSISGLIGVIVGGGWLLINFQHFEQQGLTAIGMPLIILALGAYYLVKGLTGTDKQDA